MKIKQTYYFVQTRSEFKNLKSNDVVIRCPDNLLCGSSDLDSGMHLLTRLAYWNGEINVEFKNCIENRRQPIAFSRDQVRHYLSELDEHDQIVIMPGLGSLQLPFLFWIGDALQTITLPPNSSIVWDAHGSNLRDIADPSNTSVTRTSLNESHLKELATAWEWFCSGRHCDEHSIPLSESFSIIGEHRVALLEAIQDATRTQFIGLLTQFDQRLLTAIKSTSWIKMHSVLSEVMEANQFFSEAIWLHRVVDLSTLCSPPLIEVEFEHCESNFWKSLNLRLSEAGGAVLFDRNVDGILIPQMKIGGFVSDYSTLS